MTRRLTVVQVLPALESGGVERGTLEIAQALVEAGHRSVVVSHGGRMVERLEADGSEHITLPVHRKSPWALAQVPVLRGIFQGCGADIVHARSRVPAWLSWLALRRPEGLARQPHFVTTIHGLYSVNRYSAIMTRGERVIAVSQASADYVRRNYPDTPAERIELIYRGVDPGWLHPGFQPSSSWRAAWRAEYPQLADQRVLTLPGRITRLKGHEAFIRLIGALRAAGEPVHGLIVGGAEPRKLPYRNELLAQAEAAGLTPHITFTGLRSDMREIFVSSDLVLSLSSQPESFGRTTLEALALGVPMVGWDHGGVGEILGRMLPAGRVPLGDEAALLERTRAMLQAAPVIAPLPDDFTLAHMCAATLDLYRRITAPAASSVPVAVIP